VADLALDHTLLFYLVLGLGLWMAWSVGANDFSNSAGPAIGAGVLSLREAIFIVVLFEVVGAILHGTTVTESMRKEVIDLDPRSVPPGVVVYGMLSSLLGAGLWLTFATARGWPVSTTHSIVGALVGFAVTALGVDAVHWQRIGYLLASWLLSPVVAGMIGFALIRSIGWLILGSSDPARSARRWAPLYVFLAAFVAFLMTFFRSMRPLGLDLSDGQFAILAGAFGLGLTLMGILIVQGRRPQDVEDVFAPMTLFTVCAMAFAHGANDVANAAGPMALAIEALNGSGAHPLSPGPPVWIFVLGGVGIAVGVATFGGRVIRTLGSEITALSPSRAFCTSLAATATVVMATQSGFPVSTTQTVVGAIVGVGLFGGLASVRASTVATIIRAWLITPAATAFLAGVLFFLLHSLFGA